MPLTPDDHTLIERLKETALLDIAPWTVTDKALNSWQTLIQEAENFMEKTKNYSTKTSLFEEELDSKTIEDMRKKVPSLINEIKNLIDIPKISHSHGWGIFRTPSPESIAQRASPTNK